MYWGIQKILEWLSMLLHIVFFLKNSKKFEYYYSLQPAWIPMSEISGSEQRTVSGSAFPLERRTSAMGFPFGREGHSMPTPLCIRPTRRPIGYWSSTSGDSNPSPETFLTRFCIRNWSYQFIGGFNCHVVCNNLFDVAGVQFSSLSNAVYVCISKAHLYWVVLLRFIRMSVRWALGDVQ